MSRKQALTVEQEALRRVESYQYPKAHDGHLDASQMGKLDAFKQSAQQKGYYTPPGPAGQPASHDDETLLRYLRARKFVPQDALGQFKDTEDWRKKNEIDKLYDTIDVGDYDETRALYPQWTGRRDKRGIPVYVFEILPLNGKRMKEYEKSMALKPKPKSGDVSRNLLHLFALYEHLIQFALPLCSAIPNRPFPETPVSQSNNIVDISGVGLKQFWDLKSHMQEASQLATAYYPETLDRIFIIGAPSFFPTVWSWVKRWFDPITVSKIFILSAQDAKATLRQYMNEEDIPIKYGGKLDWRWGYQPAIDPAIRESIQWVNPTKGEDGGEVFPAGPVRWETAQNGDMHAVALGTINGKQRREIIGTIPRATAVAGVHLGPDFGPSTSGTHTHPDETTEYFPTSGATPPESEASSQTSGAIPTAATTNGPPINTGIRNDTTQNARLDSRTVDAPSAVPQSNDGSATQNSSSNTTTSQAPFIASSSSQAPTAPVAASSSQPPPSEFQPPSLSSAPDQLPIRQGTSATRYEAQSGTHAAGQAKQDTPLVTDNDDKNTVIEPSTLGQAAKDVSVPEATPPARVGAAETASGADGGQEQSYLQQAKAAIGSASETVLGAVGYGGRGQVEKDTAHEESTRIISGGELLDKEVDVNKTAEAAKKVDEMPKGDVEEFIRSKYTTANQAGSKTKMEKTVNESVDAP